MDALNTYVIRRFQISSAELDRKRAFLLGDHMATLLVESLEDPSVLFGFPELFDGDWEIDASSIGNNTGHVLKAAWMLAELYLISPKESYRTGMERLLAEVWNHDLVGHEAWDDVNGAPFGNYNWQTGERSNSDKEWWMLEQAFHAGILGYFITENEVYLQMADEALAFFEEHFVDETFSEVYPATTAEGEPKSTNKGDFWKAGFHSTELG
ncbi:MAG: AGE family epimerase/isomerase [Verrucomicrobiales bacterium]